MFDFEDETFIRHHPNKYANQNAFNSSALNPWHRTDQYFHIKQKNHFSQKPLKKPNTITSYVKRSSKALRQNQFDLNNKRAADSQTLNFLIKRKKSNPAHLNRVNMAKTISLNTFGWNNNSTVALEQERGKNYQKVHQARAKTNSMHRTKQNINYHVNAQTVSVRKDKISDVKYRLNVHQIRRRLISQLDAKKDTLVQQKSIQMLQNFQNVSQTLKTLELKQIKMPQDKFKVDLSQKRKKIKSLYVGYQKFFSFKQKIVFRPIHGIKNPNSQYIEQLVNLNNFQIRRFERNNINPLTSTNPKQDIYEKNKSEQK